MTFDEYQEKAVQTAIYPIESSIIYPALGLAGEAGEVAGKVKKVLRDSGGLFDPTARGNIAAELGDVLWYCAALAQDLCIPLGVIAAVNLEKLADRKERGVLGGSGDTR